MAAGRADNMPRQPIKGEGRCEDCEAVFVVWLYPFDTKAKAFIRDHPQNGCHVTARKQPIPVRDV